LIVAIRVHIESKMCQGHQVCAAMMPELFDCDELGYGVVVGDGYVDPSPDLERVVANCPEQAIALTSD